MIQINLKFYQKENVTTLLSRGLKFVTRCTVNEIQND